MSAEIKIYETVSPPTCSSCHRLMDPREKGAVFPCPNCGKVLIRRCKSCRKHSVPYVCPNCGFKGP
uniref:DUF1610 domain-containing protein n=1 Tax=Staphylothermus marinus TaxID=2280 RepID=A0A7C4JM07_STAMA